MKCKGITLLELLIVMSIIGTLCSFFFFNDDKDSLIKEEASKLESSIDLVFSKISRIKDKLTTDEIIPDPTLPVTIKLIDKSIDSTFNAGYDSTYKPIIQKEVNIDNNYTY